ncbi:MULTISPECIES: histidine kinase [unclassified Streptomyces]|uniref:histidine kinase n=1 Tax=unclassified Streptomyces TaxID=2593676 RepID=UPI0009A0CE30|nr:MULTISPECIES: histidine kinase [unclassified Streptomyces]
MAELTGWWSRRSHPEKVELYTRWTYHGLAAVELLLGGPAAAAVAVGPAEDARPVGGWLLLLLLVHTVLVAALCSYALSWQLGRRPRPRRLIAVLTSVTVAGCVVVPALFRFGSVQDPQMTAYLLGAVVSWGVGGLALCLVKVRHLLALSLVAPLGVGLTCAAIGLPAGVVAALASATAFGAVVFATTSGFSGWLLRTVWELDAAHRLQARLAVAEERLRFARDLHDVMGRNLSVIALKSELAVQLSRRGAAERAVGQMAEVQRIAQESQREVREVVRGYREADLHTELEGARGVLAAAGVTCRVTADGLPTELPAQARSALGWVVREATTNVLRHGDARNCTVTVTAPTGGEQHVTVVIENDGADATAAAPAAGGGRGGPNGGAQSAGGLGAGTARPGAPRTGGKPEGPSRTGGGPEGAAHTGNGPDDASGTGGGRPADGSPTGNRPESRGSGGPEDASRTGDGPANRARTGDGPADRARTGDGPADRARTDGGPGNGSRAGGARTGASLAGSSGSAGSAGAATGGSGLAGLRERLVALDGTLEALALPGGRFRVTARVPLAPAPAAARAAAAPAPAAAGDPAARDAAVAAGGTQPPAAAAHAHTGADAATRGLPAPGRPGRPEAAAGCRVQRGGPVGEEGSG